MIPTLVSDATLSTKVVTIVQTIFLGLTSYFNLKHLVIPDVEQGIIAAIRSYNMVALLMELVIALEIMSENLQLNILSIVFSVICAAAYAAMIPLLRKGVAKWTI